jgi:hypothetical protein
MPWSIACWQVQLSPEHRTRPSDERRVDPKELRQVSECRGARHADAEVGGAACVAAYGFAVLTAVVVVQDAAGEVRRPATVLGIERAWKASLAVGDVAAWSRAMCTGGRGRG